MQFLSAHETSAWIKALWQHSRNARSSRARLEAGQIVRFRKLVEYARARSPYYQAVCSDYRIDPQTCRPSDFPVLTKADVLEHFDQIVTDPRVSRERIAEFLARSRDPLELFLGEFHVLHTSGTSGTVGYSVFSHDAWITGSSHIVRILPLGLRKRAAFVAATRGHFAGVSLVLTGNHGTNGLFYEVRAYDVNQPVSQIVDALNDFQPQMLSGYASLLHLLADAQRRGELRIRPTVIGNGGEPLLPEIRTALQHAFGARIVNVYATSEHLYMGMTLPGSDGMYLLEDDLIFELHPDHLCVTNLFNDTLPLIRYRMEDVLIPDSDQRARYPYLRVRELIGRCEDALCLTNCQGKEDFIHPSVIGELHFRRVHSWQIVSLNKTSFLFRLRFEPETTDVDKQSARCSIRSTLGAILAEKMMDNVRFDLEEVETLPWDPVSGKFRMVVLQTPRSTAG